MVITCTSSRVRRTGRVFVVGRPFETLLLAGAVSHGCVIGILIKGWGRRRPWNWQKWLLDVLTPTKSLLPIVIIEGRR